MRLLIPVAQIWEMGRAIHGCSHPPRSASLTQGDQEVSNWLYFFSRWLIDGLFVNAILMVGWIPTEICLMGMAGSSAELWSICRGAVVGRAEMHVAPGDGWVCTLGGWVLGLCHGSVLFFLIVFVCFSTFSVKALERVAVKSCSSHELH